jgi:hypothetical protein
MKKLIVFSFALLLSTVMVAQDKKAQPSPAATMTQVVGTTDVTIEYSRPGKKGRTIFSADGLVPFGQMWRTGANAASKITFSEDVTIGGKALAAGSYAILTVPTADKWTVHFYTHSEARWSPYKDKEPNLALEVEPVKMSETIETFMFVIDEIKDNSAVIGIVWENTFVPIPLGVK